MKKILAISLCVISVMGLIACGNTKTNEKNPDTENKTEAVMNEETDKKLSPSMQEIFNENIEELGWRDFAVNLDGNTISLPVRVIWLYQIGFKEVELEKHTHTIKGNETISATTTYKGCDIDVTIANLDAHNNIAPIQECFIIDLTIKDILKLKDCGSKIILPGGIDPYNCTEKQLLQMYGEPSSEKNKTYQWFMSENSLLEITMKNKKEIKGVTIKNNITE